MRHHSVMRNVVLQSSITCPECGHVTSETMPTDACQWFYECGNCKTVLHPKPGDCCVFCRSSARPSGKSAVVAVTDSRTSGRRSSRRTARVPNAQLSSNPKEDATLYRTARAPTGSRQRRSSRPRAWLRPSRRERSLASHRFLVPCPLPAQALCQCSRGEARVKSNLHWWWVPCSRGACGSQPESARLN